MRQSGYSLLELLISLTLRLAHGDNAIMKAAIDSTVRQRQEEKEIAALERQHEIYDEYRHCCGSC